MRLTGAILLYVVTVSRGHMGRIEFLGKRLANLQISIRKGGSYVPCGRYWLRGARVEMRFTGTE